MRITKEIIFKNIYQCLYDKCKELKTKDSLTDYLWNIDCIYTDINTMDSKENNIYKIPKQFFNLDIITEHKHYWVKTFFWVIANESFMYDIFDYDKELAPRLNKEQRIMINKLKKLFIEMR